MNNKTIKKRKKISIATEEAICRRENSVVNGYWQRCSAEECRLKPL
jgi:hypothetical protein